MAFGEGRGTALLITVDLIGVSRTVRDDLAQRLSDTGVTRASLAVGATRTHTGPSLSGVLPYIFNARPRRPSKESSTATQSRCPNGSSSWAAPRSPIAGPRGSSGVRGARGSRPTGGC